jgi:DNA-binding NarL/FixJ family response regulator
MRVVIAEDEALIQRGLRLMLEASGDFTVVDELNDVEDLEHVIANRKPDLLITDIRMPPTYTSEGLVAAIRIRELYPSLPVVVLSQHVQRTYAKKLLSSGHGRVGYLLKQRIADIDTFLDDLRRVAAGGTVLDPEVVRLLVARADKDGSVVRQLTPRQKEVLALMAEGQSNARIAAKLFLAEKSVVQHTSRIYDALGLAVDGDAHRRVLAVLQYLNGPEDQVEAPGVTPAR